MKCPYCEKDMLTGDIPNGQQPVQWIPEGERPAFLSYSIAPQGIPLNNQFHPFKINGYKAVAYCCRDCKIVLAPIGNVE